MSGCDINIYICTRSLEHYSSLLARADGWPARKHARDGEETVSGVRRRVADLSKSNGLCFPVDAFFVGWEVEGGRGRDTLAEIPLFQLTQLFSTSIST